MNNRLQSFITKHGILNNYQHGFRPRCNTTTALTKVLDIINTARDNKFLALTLFIGDNKAFDSLNHNILLNKLQSYGIRGLAFN